MFINLEIFNNNTRRNYKLIVGFSIKHLNGWEKERNTKMGVGGNNYDRNLCISYRISDKLYR